MGVGNRVIEMAEQFKIGDKVKILPNKGYGTITKITPSGFIFLGYMPNRPWIPNQLEKVDEIPRIPPVRKPVKQKSAWYRFWMERPHPLADEDTPQDFFVGIFIAFIMSLIMGGIILFIIYSLFIV